MSAQFMYRLVDEIPVRRSKGVFWTLTFRPILPHSGATVGPPRDLVVTVTDARHDALADHGPNYTGEEIEEIEAIEASPQSSRRRR
jgi:hypothetical protein